jgi:hypothetical protein
MVTKLAQIGSSQGLGLPKALIMKYHLDSGVLIEESAEGLLIKQYEIYMVDLNPTRGNEINKVWPAVVISQNEWSTLLGQ